MNNTIKSVLVLSLFTSLSMAENNNIYIGAGLVMESISTEIDDTATALEIKVGKYIDSNFAIEGRFSKTIDEATDDSLLIDSRTREKLLFTVGITTYSLWGVYNYNLTKGLIISPKIGYLKEEISTSLPSAYTQPDDVDNSGIAFGIDIKKYIPSFNADIYAGYTRVDADVSHLSFGLLKNF
jgi:hypothetical protein